MWSIELRWGERWVQLESGYTSQDDAEYAIALWKQRNRCKGDPFRTVVVPTPQPVGYRMTWEPADVM